MLASASNHHLPTDHTTPTPTPTPTPTLRRPIAVLRRLAHLHLDSSSSPFLQLPSRRRTNINDIHSHTQDDLSFHSARSHHPLSTTTSTSTSIPVDKPSFNPDIWPAFPNALVFANNNNNQPPLSTSNPRPDWTTTLGIALDSSSQLSPPPSRFSSHSRSHIASPPHKLKSHHHKLRSSAYRANLVYATYTSLARQDLEQERARQRLKSSLSFSRSHPAPHNSPLHPSNLDPSSTRPKTPSSHARSHSSASTDRLRKTPTSAFFPSHLPQSPFFPQRPRKRFRKKPPHISLSHSTTTTTTTSTKDTGASSTTHPSPSLSAPPSPAFPHSSPPAPKAAVRLRYQDALSNISNHPPVDRRIQPTMPSQTYPTLKRLTLPDLLIENDAARINPSLENVSTHHLIGSISPLPTRSAPLDSKHIPDHSITSSDHVVDPSVSSRFYNQAQTHDNPSELEFLDPEAGPSNWRERQLEAQQDYDGSRRRYRNLAHPSHHHHHHIRHMSIKTSKRSGKTTTSLKQSPVPDPRPWEYQITEQLLIESGRSRNNTPISQWTTTSYHSVKSSLYSPSDKLSASSRGPSSPLSALTPRTQSSASRVGTLVSIFTDWSRGHQTLPRPGRQSLQSGSAHGSIAMRNIKSIDSFPTALVTSSSSNGALSHFDLVDELGMYVQPPQPTLKSPLVQPSLDSNHVLPPQSPKTSSPESAARHLRKNNLVHTRSKTLMREETLGGRRPNDLTDHDQAGLLSPLETGFSSTTDPSHLYLSKLTTPSFVSHDDDHQSSTSSAASFHSWHDAPDDAFSVHHDLEPSPCHDDVVPTGLNDASPQPLQSSIAAAIVYDASPFTCPGQVPVWAQRASQLFRSSPQLTPIAAVPLRPLLRHHSTSYQVQQPTPHRRGGHKKTNSSPPAHYTFGSRIHLPVLPLTDRINKTQAIFNPRDDANFLSHPPQQLKRAWKKSQSRLKRALSEPTRPVISRALYVKTASGIDVVPSQEGPHHDTSRSSSSHAHRLTDLQKGTTTPLVPNTPLAQSSSHLPINGHKMVIHHDHDRANECLLTNPLPSDTTNTTSSLPEPTGCFHSLSLVPINAWCFVFGFVCFPLWYLGSFYPSLEPSTPSPKFNSQKPSLTYAIPDDERLEFLNPTTTPTAGPLSGWPTRGHMTQTSSTSSNSGIIIPITPVSSSEENRQPNFLTPNSHDLRALGGFWNEVAPKVDVETALALDTPIWAYHRAVHTWRLRCRVMAIVFPVIILPTSIIAAIVVMKTK